MDKLLPYLKAQGAVKVTLIAGPNGDFIKATKADLTSFTLPVGKKSQAGKLEEMNVIIAEDTGTAIATMNNYEQLEEIEL